jgi:hypothetical protein
MSKEPFEPWLWYPDIWPTKSKFYTWLRGSLRKAVWNTSPIKITFKNQNCFAPPDGYDGRAKSGNYCALSMEWEGKSKLQVDHVLGNVPLNDEEDILGFIQHLIPPPNSLQLVKVEAHKIKSYAEKQGITYSEAMREKEVIAIIKSKKEREVLLTAGITPASNAKKRREQLEQLLKENKIE